MTMNISERYRDLVAEARFLYEKLVEELPETGEGTLRKMKEALAGLSEWQESVGEIPRMKLEYRLSPILLKAHTQLDRVRLEVETLDAKQAERIWELEQTIYRLLNSL